MGKAEALPKDGLSLENGMMARTPMGAAINYDYFLVHLSSTGDLGKR
jgi:hypothetical protein